MGRDTAIADMMKRWPNAEFQEETKPSAWNGMSVFDHKNPPPSRDRCAVSDQGVGSINAYSKGMLAPIAMLLQQ